MLDLKVATEAKWLDVVLASFDAFLLDHAACERKASATGMAFIARYPDRRDMLAPMIEFAREELEHFHRVYLEIERRNLQLGPDYKDEYVQALRSWARRGGEPGLVDSLLVAGVVEARGCERLKLVADALDPSDELAALYLDLARAESRHHAFFFRLAKLYGGEAEVRERASALLDYEAQVVTSLPLLPRVH